jgi:hypothetical protein
MGADVEGQIARADEARVEPVQPRRAAAAVVGPQRAADAQRDPQRGRQSQGKSPRRLGTGAGSAHLTPDERPAVSGRSGWFRVRTVAAADADPPADVAPTFGADALRGHLSGRSYSSAFGSAAAGSCSGAGSPTEISSTSKIRV